MWMKYFNRLLYALIAALGILIVYNITDSTVKSKELTERAAAALAAEEYDYFVSVRFYQDAPIEDVTIALGDATFQVMIYDAAYISLENDVPTVVDGFVWLMIQTAGTPFENYFEIRYFNGTDTIITQLGFQIFDFPVYSGMDQNSTATLVKQSDLIVEEVFTTITSMELWVGEEQRLQIPLEINEADFLTKSAIEAYRALYGELPNASFENITMSPIIVIDSSGPAVRNILIYVAVVAIVTFLLFKAREKRLGRMTPTPGVQRDLEKLHAPKQE